MTPLPYPALHASHSGIWMAQGDEPVRALSRGEAIRLAADTPVILLNAPLVGQRLGYADLSGLDVLELFAFLHPARFMVPTPKGVAQATGLTPPGSDADVAPFLLEATARMLAVTDTDWPEREGAWTAAQSLTRARWAWAPVVTPRLRKPAQNERWLFTRLPEWSEAAPRPAPRTVTLDDRQVAERLTTLTGAGAEARGGQRAYAAAAAGAFAPRVAREVPNLVLAEAGTGIGKTLGYLAPASLWAEQAGGAVWISTYTKALQRQLGHETTRLHPNRAIRKAKVVTRKGRENYLCLLNLEDALQGGFAGRAAILAHLVARWAAYTDDGDMVGGDLPGWLTTLFRRNGSAALTDRRGECIYAGCPHYRKCFIERAARASAEADLVIANHALVMVNAARGRELATRPTRYVFDEGHHLFDAADAMFGTALTGQETIELRRWIVGPEGGSRGRRRGLQARLSDVAGYDEAGARAITDIVAAAGSLAADGWLARIAEGAPFGAIEHLLAAVRGLESLRAEHPGQGRVFATAAELHAAARDASAGEARTPASGGGKAAAATRDTPTAASAAEVADEAVAAAMALFADRRAASCGSACGSARPGLCLRLGSACGSAQPVARPAVRPAARLGSAYGSAPPAAWLGSARNFFAQLGSARLYSARLDTRLGWSANRRQCVFSCPSPPFPVSGRRRVIPGLWTGS